MAHKEKGFEKITASFSQVQKRDLTLHDFDFGRIWRAVAKAFEETGEGNGDDAKNIARQVVRKLNREASEVDAETVFAPSVEHIQDLVEKELMHQDYATTAKSYILYRQKRSDERKSRGVIDPVVRENIRKNSEYFASPYSEFIFYRTYAKWVPELGRRETWTESIDRYMEFMKENLGDKFSLQDYADMREAILKQEICPSMRLLWSSGKACRQSNVWAYNCSFTAPEKWQDLGEVMYILMCGAGLGFTVERESVEKFPKIEKQTGEKLPTHVVGDSKEGWADAFVLACTTWASGKDIDFDYSQVHPAGARLSVAGGTASGPQPLMDLMTFTRSKMLSKQGEKLDPIDVHDITCQIGLIVVAGGVRRSALISLSDLDDVEMRESKQGQFWVDNGQRSMANNSAVYNKKPTAEEFLEEWTSLVKSKSGERGIFNRGGFEKQMPARRWATAKDQKFMGVNPCGEILLRSKQFCNLTSIVVRPNDTVEDLRRKIRTSTMIGTYQASLTNFGYLSEEWKKNCEEEALLGVSITGYYDNPIIRNDEVLEEMRDYSIEVNKEYAAKLGINPSASITTVKPHGNSGQLLSVGSGMHPWFAPYFIRRVRIGKNDPLYRFAKDQGVPCQPEVGYSNASATTMVLEFPVKAPEGAIFNKDVSALEMLHEWKRIKEHYVEHNPSVTIYVGEDEWLEVANFVYKNWEIVGGLSFLPRTDHVYQLAPYEEIDQVEYEKRMKELGDMDFSKLIQYEQEDNTTGSKEFACVSGVCTVDDVVATESEQSLEASAVSA